MIILIALVCIFGFLASTPSTSDVPRQTPSESPVVHASVERAQVPTELIASCDPQAMHTRDLTRPFNETGDTSPITVCTDE